METWISQNEQHQLSHSSEPDVESYHDSEALPEPESWQLADFEDIVPHDLSELETEHDSATAYGY